jgi:hypothetical protein
MASKEFQALPSPMELVTDEGNFGTIAAVALTAAIYGRAFEGPFGVFARGVSYVATGALALNAFLPREAQEPAQIYPYDLVELY